jgi:hypothetical protein
VTTKYEHTVSQLCSGVGRGDPLAFIICWKSYVTGFGRTRV